MLSIEHADCTASTRQHELSRGHFVGIGDLPDVCSFLTAVFERLRSHKKKRFSQGCILVLRIRFLQVTVTKRKVTGVAGGQQH